MAILTVTAHADTNDFSTYDAATKVLTIPVIASQQGEDLRVFNAKLRITGDGTAVILATDEIFCGFSPVNWECTQVKRIK